MEYRQCVEAGCLLRFPVAAAAMLDECCPRCSSATEVVFQSTTIRPEAPPDFTQFNKPISVILDNLRSAYNVGSIFRTADGAGLNHLYLCGITPQKDHPKVLKTALGAENSIESSHHLNGLSLVSGLKSTGYYLIALESNIRAVSIFDSELHLPDMPVGLVLGNELVGVDPDIVEMCDLVVALPMMGRKHSLNVVVAFGIAVYKLRFDLAQEEITERPN